MYSLNLCISQYVMLLNVLGWYKSNCGFRPSSPPHPSGLSQSTGFECPASCIELALVVYFTYGDIHISMPSFQIIPPSPSPTESKSLFLYLCLFCCLACRIIITIFLNTMYMHQYTVFVSLFLTYSTLYNLIRTDSNAFLFIAE